MTYSIMAFDAQSGAIGVASATASVAVGGFVTHARMGVGAIITQGAYTNWMYGERGLQLLEQGMTAAEVCQRLVDTDQGQPYRQLLVCDATGATAGHSGHANLEYLAHHCEANLALAGNMLMDANVLPAMQQAFVAGAARPLHERLLLALKAGEQAGGDYRGTHSAAVKVFYEHQPPVDLRIDWAEQGCLEQLEALYQQTKSKVYREFLAGVPTPEDPHKWGPVWQPEVNG